LVITAFLNPQLNSSLVKVVCLHCAGESVAVFTIALSAAVCVANAVVSVAANNVLVCGVFCTNNTFFINVHGLNVPALI